MKKMLTMAEIESQTVLQLPERRMLGLITVIIADVANNLSISVDVSNNNVAVQVCAVVNAINTILVGQQLTCTIPQH
jgi:hypothetical protein